MNVPSKRIVVALAYARNTRVFELLDDIAPGPAVSTVLSPYPLVSLVALNIIQARNSHDSHSACGISSNKVATRKTIHIGGRDGWKVSGSNPSCGILREQFRAETRKNHLPHSEISAKMITRPHAALGLEPRAVPFPENQYQTSTSLLATPISTSKWQPKRLRTAIIHVCSGSQRLAPHKC
jgi:hypothetical protein